MIYIILLILVLCIIIITHEFGHFIFAKLFKVPVIEFSLGMGPVIFKKHIGKTIYAVKALPLGGSCLMAGEGITGTGVPSNIKRLITLSGYTWEEIRANGLDTIAWWKKVLIGFAGPGTNLLTAILLCIILSFMGRYSEPIIDAVKEGSSAYNAQPYGLQEGDKIINITDEKKSSNIRTLEDIVSHLVYRQFKVASVSEMEMTITFQRDKEILKTNLITNPATENMFGCKILGGSKGLSIGKKFIGGFKLFMSYWDLNILTFRLLFEGKVEHKDLGGVIGVVQVGNDTLKTIDAEKGTKAALIFLILFTVVICINLAIMNLLPLSILDGGVILFAIIAGLGIKVPKILQSIFDVIAIGVLMILLYISFIADIARLSNISLSTETSLNNPVGWFLILTQILVIVVLVITIIAVIQGIRKTKIRNNLMATASRAREIVEQK